MIQHAEPTGRWRHRIWKGRLVLQIEERGLHTYSIGGHAETDRVRRWRDAQPEDLTVTGQALPANAKPEIGTPQK